MELIQTDDHLIVQNLQQTEHSLWCCRHTAQFSIRPSWELASETNPECLGAVWGLVGKLRIHPGVDDRLAFIRDCERVGEMYDTLRRTTHPVYRVRTVSLVAITSQQNRVQPPLKPCPKHHVGRWISVIM